MATVNVPRAELARLVGVSPDVDDATLHAAIEKTIAAQKARETAAARSGMEQRLEAEDRRIVAAAINDGRLSPGSRERWLKALKTNRGANRSVLASLAPGLRPTEKVVADQELEQLYGHVMAQMGFQPAAVSPPARSVAASSQPVPSSGQSVDMLGLPVSPAPDPVRISRGTPPEQWTRKQQSDYLQRQLGPRFWPGTEPPPAADQWYWPSPDDVAEYVETADGQSYWQDKDGYVGRI